MELHKTKNSDSMTPITPLCDIISAQENIMGITIRKATLKDAHDYAVCHISCFQSAYKGIVPNEYLTKMAEKKEQRVEKYKKSLADPGDCEYYCAIYEERMIGFLIINKGHDEDKLSVGEIWAIYLLAEFRNKGCGEKILDFAINELKRIEPDEIFLWVLEENYSARRFYEKHGFSFNGTKREAEYGKPLIQLRYVLNLI